MKKTGWKKKIIEYCKKAGTYQDFFEETIATLAAILEKRDEVEKVYKDGGKEPLIEYTNKAGATNVIKNPALVLWDELNKSALAYWRDLGLTPAGLKKIDEQGLKGKKTDPLSEVLKDLGG
ncbi:MAG: P27 family phage terminase small subunit [Lachnospiraceae bacterium]|nr:P27 family phage terminase small subunit [Lachnospiraceae bacterium]